MVYRIKSADNRRWVFQAGPEQRKNWPNSSLMHSEAALSASWSRWDAWHPCFTQFEQVPGCPPFRKMKFLLAGSARSVIVIHHGCVTDVDRALAVLPLRSLAMVELLQFCMRCDILSGIRQRVGFRCCRFTKLGEIKVSRDVHVHIIGARW